jgi:ribosomal protein S24E
MNDKLAALKATAANDIAVDVEGDRLAPAGDGLAKSGSQFASTSFMQDFFRDVEMVKDGIKAVKDATRRIEEIAEASLMAVSHESEAELSEQLTAIIDDANKRAKQTKSILKKVKDDTEEGKASMKSSEVRIRENLCNTLTRKFVTVTKEYQNQQTKYKTDIKKKVSRQLQTVKPDVTEEEIENIMAQGPANVEQVYRAAILQDAADPIKNAYNDVTDKCVQAPRGHKRGEPEDASFGSHTRAHPPPPYSAPHPARDGGGGRASRESGTRTRLLSPADRARTNAPRPPPPFAPPTLTHTLLLVRGGHVSTHHRSRGAGTRTC